MKLFQYDKKVWDDGIADHTLQFGIINNRSLLWVHYQELPISVYKGLHILLSFFTSSLFGVDFQVSKYDLSFNFFTEYFEGWNDD
jgi:hypothetical protein